METWMKFGVGLSLAIGGIWLSHMFLNKKLAKKKETLTVDYSRKDVHQQKAVEKPKQTQLSSESMNHPVSTKKPTAVLPSIPNVSNAQIARKLIADPMFQLSPQRNGMEDHVRSIMKRAMWDGVREEFKSHKLNRDAGVKSSFQKTLALCSEVRSRLTAVTPNRPDLQREVNDIVDIEMIDQMLQNEVFDSEELDKIIRAVMDRVISLESPQRNKDTREWLDKLDTDEWRNHDTLDRFEFFLDYFHEKLDLLHLDMANFQLRMIAPVIKTQGIEYVRKAFHDLHGESPTLPRLDAWALAIAGEVTGEQVGESNSDSVACKKHLQRVFETVWTSGTSFNASNEQQPASTLPETWDGELDLVDQLERQLQALCRVAYFVMRMRQHQPRLLVSPEYASNLTSSIFAFLLADIPPSVVSVGDDGKLSMVGISAGPDGKGPGAKMVLKHVQEHISKEYPGETVDVSSESFSESVKSALFPEVEDAVFVLVKKRLRLLIERSLQKGLERSKGEKNPDTPDALNHVIAILNEESEKSLHGLGIGCLKQQSVRVALGILSFAQRDWAIHSDTYERVFE